MPKSLSKLVHLPSLWPHTPLCRYAAKPLTTTQQSCPQPRPHLSVCLPASVGPTSVLCLIHEGFKLRIHGQWVFSMWTPSSQGYREPSWHLHRIQTWQCQLSWGCCPPPGSCRQRARGPLR